MSPSSSSKRPFKRAFEKQVNTNMQKMADADRKLSPATLETGVDCGDEDWSEKRDPPPRFSTLFPAAPPSFPERSVERPAELPPRPSRAPGVFLTTPVFIIIMATLTLEAMILFAYTTIGLYSNLPNRFVPNMRQVPQAINVAPNIVVPAASNGPAETITLISTTIVTTTASTTVTTTEATTATTTDATTDTTTATATTSVTPTSTADESSKAAVMISDILGALSSRWTSNAVSTVTAVPSSTVFLTVVPPQSTVQSVTYLTVNPGGTPITSKTRTTVTSTTVIDATALPSKSG
ncbi:hypothetical protein K470DRAFT_268015 [Piedraia hortae CBS 480.64]|uniref:Uncharacterized protein n=1 Tax=Piedraia hortae CBS 480.64 TaxID=1314780 RepID=A0A6A7C852_9PEZI|nr:hypothetical protein K470DRAFT_268015 [Piedraia hortae CBS 480.64]